MNYTPRTLSIIQDLRLKIHRLYCYYLRITSSTIATTIRTSPNQAIPRPENSETSSKPKPKPNKLCIIAWGVKQSFILAFIFLPPLNKHTSIQTVLLYFMDDGPKPA